MCYIIDSVYNYRLSTHLFKSDRRKMCGRKMIRIELHLESYRIQFSRSHGNDYR